VALMGRNHPLGIVLSSLLFGLIFQGGAEVAFEVKNFTKDMVVMLQGFIVLFSGAMAYATAPLVARMYHFLAPKQHDRTVEAAHG
jgi:general nucleoside transport system permease protein